MPPWRFYSDAMTFDWLALQRKAHAEFAERLAVVTDWEAPTPDPGWDVRGLVRHVIDEQRWVAPLVSGRPMEEAGADIQPVGDDLHAEWARYSEAATAAWTAADPNTPVRLSRDTVTVEEYLREQVGDVVVHTWDLARATGSREELDPELVEAAWTIFAGSGDKQEICMFAPRMPLDESAPLQEKLLTLAGRDPRRQAA